MRRLLEHPKVDYRVTGWCPVCHLSWTESKDAHCVRCCRHFASEQAFDAHQRLNTHRRTVCRDPAKLNGRLILDGQTWNLAAKTGRANASSN